MSGISSTTLRDGGGGVLRGVATKNGALGGVPGTNISNNTNDGDTTTYRLGHLTPATVGINGIVLNFANWRLAPAETNGANDITVKAAVEYNGAYVPVTFAGQRTITLTPGQEVQSDPIAIQIPAGATFYERTQVTVTTGGTWPIGRGLAIAGDGWSGKNGADLVDGTGTTGFTLAGKTIYSAAAIIGYQSGGRVACVMPIGDSIWAGSGASAVDAQGNLSCVERALSNTYAWLTLTKSSQRFSTFNTANAKQLAYRLAASTSVICELGINDIYTGSDSLATLQGRAIAAWTTMGDGGRVPVWQTTITPQTTSTDSWATTVNQTISDAGKNTVRTSFNDWLRDGAPMSAGVAVATGTVGALRAGEAGHPLRDHVEIADVAETSRNSGIWNVTGAAFGYTTDGTHPSTAMHVLFATPIAAVPFV